MRLVAILTSIHHAHSPISAHFSLILTQTYSKNILFENTKTQQTQQVCVANQRPQNSYPSQASYHKCAIFKHMKSDDIERKPVYSDCKSAESTSRDIEIKQVYMEIDLQYCIASAAKREAKARASGSSSEYAKFLVRESNIAREVFAHKRASSTSTNSLASKTTSKPSSLSIWHSNHVPSNWPYSKTIPVYTIVDEPKSFTTVTSSDPQNPCSQSKKAADKKTSLYINDKRINPRCQHLCDKLRPKVKLTKSQNSVSDKDKQLRKISKKCISK